MWSCWGGVTMIFVSGGTLSSTLRHHESQDFDEMLSNSDALSQSIVGILSAASSHETTEITPELELVADLAFDSAKILDLLMNLEDSLGIEIDEEDIIDLTTVGDIIEIVQYQLSKRD